MEELGLRDAAERMRVRLGGAVGCGIVGGKVEFVGLVEGAIECQGDWRIEGWPKKCSMKVVEGDVIGIGTGLD